MSRNKYMTFFRILMVLLLGLFTIPDFYGCAPSSSSQRYNPEKQKKKNQTSTKVRFQPPAVKDTVLTEDELFDDEEELEDYSAEEDSLIILKLMNRYSIPPENLDPNTISIKDKVIMEIIKYLNTPYKYGGNSWKGIDCSAFTKTVIGNIFSFELPRSAREQFTVGENINRENLQFGDLVFFNTRRRVRPGHVGIYIGDNLFAHASRKYGVTVSSLESAYYNRTYMGARRLEELEF